MPTSALVSYMSVRPVGAGFPVPCSVHPVGYDHAREAGRSYQIALRAIRLSKNIKLGFWLSALRSLTTEGDAKLRQKRIKSAVGALIERPVRHRRTICRRQIQNGSHHTGVWIVCFRKRCLLRKRGRSMIAPTACLLI